MFQPKCSFCFQHEFFSSAHFCLLLITFLPGSISGSLDVKKLKKEKEIVVFLLICLSIFPSSIQTIVFTSFGESKVYLSKA